MGCFFRLGLNHFSNERSASLDRALCALSDICGFSTRAAPASGQRKKNAKDALAGSVPAEIVTVETSGCLQGIAITQTHKSLWSVDS